MPNILETINRVRQEIENSKRKAEQEYEGQTQRASKKEQERTREAEEQKDALVKKFEELVEKTGIKTEMELIGRNLIGPDATWQISSDKPETKGWNTIARINLEWSGTFPDKKITCEFDLIKEELIIYGAIVREPSLSIKECSADKEKMREQLARAYLEPSIKPSFSGPDKPDYGGFVD